MKIIYEQIPVIKNNDGTVKHIIKEGARYHVLHYDSDGIHCSEPNCEINVSEKPHNPKIQQYHDIPTNHNRF